MRLTDLILRPFDLVVPPTCAGCGLPGDGVCIVCRGAVRRPVTPGCRRCSHPWAVWADRCAECPAAIETLRFAVAYDDPVPAIVSALKDRRRPALAHTLAAIIAECVPPPAGEAVLIPVPLTRSRLRARGFNQAALLAEALAGRWELPTAASLARLRDDRPQRGLSATDRATNVRGAFVASGPPAGTVWLVDDVCTTGATLSACARTLRRAGARHVNAVCFARVLR